MWMAATTRWCGWGDAAALQTCAAWQRCFVTAAITHLPHFLKKPGINLRSELKPPCALGCAAKHAGECEFMQRADGVPARQAEEPMRIKCRGLAQLTGIAQAGGFNIKPGATGEFLCQTRAQAFAGLQGFAPPAINRVAKQPMMRVAEAAAQAAQGRP